MLLQFYAEVDKAQLPINEFREQDPQNFIKVTVMVSASDFILETEEINDYCMKLVKNQICCQLITFFDKFKSILNILY